MIAPTTAIAEIAFVRDMRGVWRRRETRRMTSRPTNVASMKTNRAEMKSKEGSEETELVEDSEASVADALNIQTPSTKLQAPNGASLQYPGHRVAAHTFPLTPAL